MTEHSSGVKPQWWLSPLDLNCTRHKPDKQACRLTTPSLVRAAAAICTCLPVDGSPHAGSMLPLVPAGCEEAQTTDIDLKAGKSHDVAAGSASI